MKLTKIDEEELKERMRRNFKERLEFIRKYAEWVKNTPDEVWSTQQRKLFATQQKRKSKD